MAILGRKMYIEGGERMYRSNSKAFTNITQILLDLISIIISFMITFSIVSFFVSDQTLIAERHLWILIIYTPVFFMSMYTMEMYNLSTFNYQDRIVKNVLLSCLLSTFFCVVLAPFIMDSQGKYYFLGYFILIAAVILSFEHCFSLTIIQKLRNKGICRTIIVGNAKMIENYIYYIGKTSFRYDLVGYIPVDNNAGNDACSKFLGTIENMEEILNENVVDEVVFALSRHYKGDVEKFVLMCEERGLTVKLVLDLFDLHISKTCMLSIGTLPVLTYHTVSLNNTQLLIKRIMDIIGSLVGLIFTFIISIFVVPAIKLDSKGPVFFKQVRVGQNGRHFSLYKFRSMCNDAEQKKRELVEQNKIKGDYMFKIDNDPRITKLGSFLRKTSIDELPQFINVLKGEMSLVGTRPPTLGEVEKYNNLHYRRISIKPGITGLWQISGRSNITDFDEVVRLDTSYIDNWSVWKDIEIIIKTVFMLLFKRKGAY